MGVDDLHTGRDRPTENSMSEKTPASYWRPSCYSLRSAHRGISRWGGRLGSWLVFHRNRPWGFDQLGIHHVTMWQLGVALGFLSGFVRGR